MRKYLPPPHKFTQKTLDSTDTVDFTHFRRTVNRYCGHIYPSLVLVQPRKTRPYITERLLMGRKESNQTKNVISNNVAF